MSYLTLYSPEETAFTSNGLGILSDVIDDEVYEELNGQFELTVKYPVEGIHFAQIVTDGYITAKPNPASDPQPFRIYRITKPMRGTVTIYARHIVYRCRKIVAAPFFAALADGAMEQLKAKAANDCPFTFWTDISTVAEMNVTVPTDLWTLMGSSEGCVLDLYGGEYEFDKYAVRLWKQRGADRGVAIRYGKNLTDLTMDENIADVFNGVYPYWTNSDGVYVELPEKYIMAEGNYPEPNILPVDLSQTLPGDPPDELLLRVAAEGYMEDNGIGKPEISWTISFVQLAQTEEYKDMAQLDQILLGDTVTVIFPKMNIHVAARAVAVRYQPSMDRYKNITLGSVKRSLTATVARMGRAIKK